MKSNFLFLILLLILSSFSMISAVEIQMRDSFKQGETLMAKISGNFLDPVLKENIQFYRGHVKVPMDFDITQINEEFYLYSVLPETSNNYSLVVEDVRYKKGSQVLDDDFSKNFSITEETIDFSVSPGFIVTLGGFSLKVQNLQDTAITINVNSEKDLYLKSGDEEIINFETNENKTILKEVTLSSTNTQYNIPVYVIVNDTSLQLDDFDFLKSELNLTFIINTNRSIPIYIKNYGEKEIANISLSVSRELRPYVYLSQEEIIELESGKERRFDIYFMSDKEIELEGSISAITEQKLVYLPINLNFIKGFIPDNTTEEIPYMVETQDTCEDLEGNKCKETEYCVESAIINAVDGECCLTECKDLKDSGNGNNGGTSSTSKTIGWIIIIAIVLVIVWFFFKKYKKAK